MQTQLVADIAQGFFNLLMLDKQLDIARHNLLLSDSFLVATRLLKDAGVGNALGVQQAEAQKQSTALLIPQLEQNIAIQENALQVLTGQFPGSVARKVSLNEFAVANDLDAGFAGGDGQPETRCSFFRNGFDDMPIHRLGLHRPICILR